MKYALVTGASRGIGRAIAIQLAQDGYPVIINYLSNHAAAEETLRMIQDNGGSAELLPFDVSHPAAIQAALTDWQTRHPEDYIDVLVNNAGIVRDNILLDMSPEDWHAVMDTNLNGFFYITRFVVEDMVMHHHGRIISISSIAAQHPFIGHSNYSAAKGAIESATRALALELAPKNITVNAIAPGLIETEMVVQDPLISNLSAEIIKQHFPMKRLGKPEEVAYLTSFIASEKAAYISGQVIGINGMYGSI